MSSVLSDMCAVYSKSTDGKMHLTKNFVVNEFASKDGTDPVVIHVLIPVICQVVRNWFGYPFAPNSAYRSLTHNKNEGGAANSFHVYGKAVDIPVKNGMSPKELYDFLDKLCGDSCEIGLYRWGVHVGVSDTKKRFVDSSYKG